MADNNIQIPNDLTEVIEIKVIDKSKVLRNFLTSLANKVQSLEDRVKELENGN